MKAYSSSSSRSADRGIRCDPHRPRLAGEDPLLVLRRGEEAGDHQLPHLQAERDGLFCARIFGPIKDYECVCGNTSA